MGVNTAIRATLVGTVNFTNRVILNTATGNILGPGQFGDKTRENFTVWIIWDIDSEDLTNLLSSLFGIFHWLGYCLEET